MAVFDAKQLIAHGVKAISFLPIFSRLNHGHGHFYRACAVHFLTHNGFYLAYDAQTHGHVSVDACTQFFDHTGAHHQLVAGDFSVGWGFFEGGDEELRGFHGGLFVERENLLEIIKNS